MTAPIPIRGAPATPQPSARVPGIRSYGRWLVLVAVFLLAVAGAAWYWWSRPAPVDPPIPARIEDPEVQTALELARRQVRDRPESAAAWGHLGKTLLAHMFPHEADLCFAQAARLEPTNPMWIYARGMIAVREDPKRPVVMLREAVARGDPRSDLRADMAMQLAEVLLERGELDEAAELFRQELDRALNNPRAAFGLGVIAASRGDRPAAMNLLTIAWSSPYARKRASAQLATLARAHGDHETADRFEKQATSSPDDPPWRDPLFDGLGDLRVGRKGRERRATLLEQQGKYAEAAEVYLEQVARQPDAWAYVGAGLNLARLRKHQQALPLLRTAVRLWPDHAEAHFCLALALFTEASEQTKRAPAQRVREEFREAVAQARQAAEQRPNHPETYLIWGLALNGLGETRAAIEALRKGIICAPGDVRLQLALGEALLENGQLKEAQTHLETARQLAPRDPRPAQALQKLRLKKG